MLTSVGTCAGPADVWGCNGEVGGMIIGGVLVVVVVGSVVVVVADVLVVAVVLADVLGAEFLVLDGGCLTCFAGIFFLLEEPTSSTSCYCSCFFCTRASALTSKVSDLFCLASAASSAMMLADSSISFALPTLADSALAVV